MRKIKWKERQTHAGQTTGENVELENAAVDALAGCGRCFLMTLLTDGHAETMRPDRGLL